MEVNQGPTTMANKRFEFSTFRELRDILNTLTEEQLDRPVFYYNPCADREGYEPMEALNVMRIHDGSSHVCDGSHPSYNKINTNPLSGLELKVGDPYMLPLL
jgi:hypothetical protein